MRKESVYGREGPVRPQPMRMESLLGDNPQAVRRRLEMLEALLERSFILPIFKRPIGMDAIVGLVPVIGDMVMAAMGSYFIWETRKLGLPRWQLWRMAGHVAVDGLLGAVPVAGDLFDVLYRSNTRNLKIILRHLDRHHPETRVIEG